MPARWEAGPGVVELPDGRRLLGRALGAGGPAPDFALLLLGRRPPAVPWPSRWVRWPDLGVPLRPHDADAAVLELLARAERQRVAVMCAHGRGRTGSVVALLAALTGVPPRQAVAWARSEYHPRAAEAPWQRRWVVRAAHRLGR